MLRIYPVILEVLKELQPLSRRIELKDRDLGRQLRRCSASVALNVAEGMYSRERNRNAQYHLGALMEDLAKPPFETVVALAIDRFMSKRDLDARCARRGGDEVDAAALGDVVHARADDAE